MAPWKPSLAPGLDLLGLPLTPHEAFVASRLDGATEPAALALATGLPLPMVEATLQKLVALGALAGAGEGPQAPVTELTPAPHPRAEALRATPPVAPPRAEAPRATPPAAPPRAEAPRAVRPPAPPPAPPAAPLDDADDADDAPGAAPAHAAAPPGDAPDDPAAADAPLAAHAEPDPDPAHAAPPPLDAPSVDGPRALFRATFQPLAPEARIAHASDAVEPELSALCLDPAPGVVRALLDNPRFGPLHARLVAAHHPAADGLDALAARASLLADPGVRRALLRNPHLSVALLRRLLAGRPLLEHHQLAHSHEVADGTRRHARELLRARFAVAPPEERVQLIVKTEGRCFASLVGVPIDGKTAALLCQQTFATTLFVTNVAQWSAAPPRLIAHLLRSELVRRSPVLRARLQRHPNAPSGGGDPRA